MKKRFIIFISILAGLAVATGAFFVFRADRENHLVNLHAYVQHGLSDVKADIVENVSRKTHFVKVLESVIRTNPDLSRQEFEIIMRGALDGLHDIRSVRLVQGDRVTHAYPAPERDAAGTRPEAEFAVLRDLYMQDEREGMAHVSYNGDERTAPTQLTVFAPVFVPAEDGGRRKWGMIEVDVDILAFLAIAGLAEVPSDILVALSVSGSKPDRDMVLYGNPLVFDMEPLGADILFFSKVWHLAAVPARGWAFSPLGKYIIGGGSVLALLTAVSLWVTLSVLMGRFRDREKYRYLVETAKAIILRLDLSGQIEFCNEYAEQFYGYVHGELVGKPLVGTLVPEKDLEGQSMKRYIGKLLMNPTAHPFNEAMNVRKNGEIVWVAWANQPILAGDGTMVGLLCVGTDITDRKLMEESLRQREKQYRLLAENVSDVIWGLDADLRYTYVSPSDEMVRGFKRYEVLGLPIKEFLTPASMNRLVDTLSCLEKGVGSRSVTDSAIEDLEFTCMDGTTVWLESRLGLMLNDEGDRIGIQGVSRDITDRKRAEALRGDMERIAKHDLKTPLGAVIGLPGEIRRSGPLTSVQEGLLDTIENAGGAMLALINRSLDLYKMECGTFVLERSPVDVVAMLERIKAEAQFHIRSKGISIGIETIGAEAGGPFLVNADTVLFQSMLSNLLINALEASPESGAVSIILEKGEALSITIRNKGEVPPEMREVFFDKYANSNKASGSGLGTYSARLIARTHGGDITVDTATPGETGVTVILPG